MLYRSHCTVYIFCPLILRCNGRTRPALLLLHTGNSEATFRRSPFHPTFQPRDGLSYQNEYLRTPLHHRFLFFIDFTATVRFCQPWIYGIYKHEFVKCLIASLLKQPIIASSVIFTYAAFTFDVIILLISHTSIHAVFSQYYTFSDTMSNRSLPKSSDSIPPKK